MNYKYGNAKILLANSTLFSCGMNLENSTHVLFIHRIEDKIIHQVLGRAQRLGRTCQLEVIHLEYENEMKVEVKKTKDEITIEEFETKATTYYVDCKTGIRRLFDDSNEIFFRESYNKVTDLTDDFSDFIVYGQGNILKDKIVKKFKRRYTSKVREDDYKRFYLFDTEPNILQFEAMIEF